METEEEKRARLENDAATKWLSLAMETDEERKEKMVSITVPITGRASSFLEFFCFLKLQSQSKLNPNQI